jgi:thiosulfate/3-mercaptopyruvate sulfurtransferase
MNLYGRPRCLSPTILLFAWCVLGQPEWTGVGRTEAFPTPQVLVETLELEKDLARADLRIVDLRPAARYSEGHIPNAVALDPALLHDTAANRSGLPIPLSKASKIFGGLGIDGDTRVVAYDDADGLYAARLVYVLEAVGHRQAAILNGGWAKWIAERRPAASDVPSIATRRFMAWSNQEPTATLDDVQASLKKRGAVLVDARSPAEARGGHIPGAVNLHWTRTIDPVTGTFRPPGELRQLFADAGATRDKELIIYCVSGLQASHLYVVARLLHYPRVRNYDGAWREWTARPELPIEK